MSKFFSFCSTNNKKHCLKTNHNFKPRAKKVRRGYGFNYYLSCFLLCLIFVAVGFYIFNTTSSVTKGFAISEYEQKIYDLQLANDSLQEKVANLGDLNYVKEKSMELGLVLVNEVEYLDTNNGGVVMGK